MCDFYICKIKLYCDLSVYKCIKVNTEDYFANSEYTILQACKTINIDIPYFCYHEKLGIAGNCRLCLVEIRNSKKLVVACATTVEQDMDIYTENLRVQRARESILEFLLAGHPLDCPICDQGGECDLQDLTIIYGTDRGRRYEQYKRAVEDKDIGPFIKTFMTRCIHCTRCVRFLNEVTADYNLGTVARGSHMEISTYIKNQLHNPLSNNVIDLCPVGALTAKPYAFSYRSWESQIFETIDMFDSLSSNIRIDIYNNKILRILPQVNLNMFDSWLTNKTRFAYLGVLFQRQISPLYTIFYVDKQIHVKCSWNNIFKYIGLLFMQNFIKRVEVMLGMFTDITSIVSMQQFFSSIGCGILTKYKYCVDFKNSYLLNDNLENIETLDGIILVGFDPRVELPLFNLKLRKNYLNNEFPVYSIGLGITSITYEVINIGNLSKVIVDLCFGLHEFCQQLQLFEKLKFFVGLSVFERMDSVNIFDVFKKISKNLKKNDILSVVLPFTGLINYFDVGNVEGPINLHAKGYRLNYILGDIESILNIEGVVIHQGIYGDIESKNKVVAMPGLSFLETNGLFVNIKGAYNYVNKLITNSTHARSNKSIFKALSIYLHNYKVLKNTYVCFKLLNLTTYNRLFGNVLNIFLFSIPYMFKNFYNYKNFKIVPHFDIILKDAEILDFFKNNVKKIINSVSVELFSNFYTSDVISKHAKIMSASAIIEDFWY